MAVGDGSEPVTDDEVVFRRVSEASGWYNPASDRPVAWMAFRPNSNDNTGLSVWREKYKSAMEVAKTQSRPGGRYFVLAMSAGRLRESGVVLEASPDEGGPGHASLTNMNARSYLEDKAGIRLLANTIAELLVESVDGPFGPFDVQPI